MNIILKWLVGAGESWKLGITGRQTLETEGILCGIFLGRNKRVVFMGMRLYKLCFRRTHQNNSREIAKR